MRSSDRYRVLRYDARGHGGSPATAGDYSLDMLVADAVGILDSLGIRQAHFGGLSMGGMVGLGLLLDHPKRVRSAVIADSRHTTRPDFTAAWLERAEAVRTGGVEAIVQSTVDRWSSAGLAERSPAIVARMRTMIRRTSAEGYRGCAAALARLNYGHRLGEIHAPTLLICGSEDHGAPPENTRRDAGCDQGLALRRDRQAPAISRISRQPKVFNDAVRALSSATWIVRSHRFRLLNEFE